MSALVRRETGLMRGRAGWLAALGLATLLAAGLGLGKSVAQAQDAAPPSGSAADSAPAPSLLDRLGVDGSLRGGAWSSDRDLDDRTDFSTGSIWLRMAPKLSESWSAKLEGWAQGQGSQGDSRGRQELREAYVAYAGQDYDVRAGRQIVVWGRADQVNPTDNLGSRDFTLLFPEPDDLRRGSGMVRVGRAFAGATLTVVWLPEFRPNVYPVGALPPNIRLGEGEAPEQFDQAAVKLDRTGGTVDWSASYFDGLDRNPDVALQRIDATGVTLQLRYHRIRVVGADFAVNVGRFGLRGEAAYTDTADPTGSDPQLKNPYFFAVLGADRSFGDTLNLNVQLIHRATASYRDPHSLADPLLRVVAIQNALAAGQVTPTQTGMSTRIGTKWLHETLEVELAAVGYFEKGDSLLRAKLLYHWTDTLRLTIGREAYDGPDESFFGRLRDNSVTFAELAYGY